MTNLQDDLAKAKAAEQSALNDINQAQGWIASNPRLAALAAFLAGLICGALASCVHLFK